MDSKAYADGRKPPQTVTGQPPGLLTALPATLAKRGSRAADAQFHVQKCTAPAHELGVGDSRPDLLKSRDHRRSQTGGASLEAGDKLAECTDATTYCIRWFNEDIWLHVEFPRKWGPAAQAKRYPTRDDAVRALSRLSYSDGRKKLHIVAVPDT
jgi:hypothetical protein